MCTLTYLPLLNSAYILTSSRDESPARLKALPPGEHIVGNRNVLYPEDQQSHGTWIAASRQISLCLMNGAFDRHVSNPPYRHSRGLVIPGSFAYTSISDFLDRYSFFDLEPFTLVAVERREKLTLHEIRWDGKSVSHVTPDATVTHIWSSTMLYPEEVRKKRESWFNTWKHRHDFRRENILDFHKSAGEGDPETNVLMNYRGIVLTVSITCIENSTERVSMSYYDRDTGEEYRNVLE